jgi:DNA invertase Pin-like site-specific DNA recombinase
MPAFVAYFRVSTDRQKASGLGLEAQRAAVLAHIGGEQLLAEYTEAESGKNHTNRPQLLAALAECRRKKATLVIAKLDRLAGNVAFISALMESGSEFVCCDNPHANRLMLHTRTIETLEYTIALPTAARWRCVDPVTPMPTAGPQLTTL